MKSLAALAAPALVLALTVGACSPGSNATDPAPANDAADERAVPSPPIPEPTPPATPPPGASTSVLGREGLGDLLVGGPVPGGGSWAERGAQVSDDCRTVSSPNYPGVYAIVSEGKVERITIGQRSNLELAGGIGIGANEADVRKSFPGLNEEPHKYEAAPAKYLTEPSAASGRSALRFEIGGDGKVKLIHAGAMPVLGYVEGCA